MSRYTTTSLVLAAGALSIAGCGSASPGSGTAAASVVANRSQVGLAFAKCMRAHGVPNFPDPGGTGGGGIQIQAKQIAGSGATMTVNGVAVSAPAFQAAMQACRADLPKRGNSAQSVAGAEKAALAMARCMRSHGVPNFPDPSVRQGPGGGGLLFHIGAGSGADPSSPAFKAAQRVCQPQAGLGLGGP